MKKEFCLEVSGAMACFTRPEMKVERVSYDAMTPSAARSVFEAIFGSPKSAGEYRRSRFCTPSAGSASAVTKSLPKLRYVMRKQR